MALSYLDIHGNARGAPFFYARPSTMPIIIVPYLGITGISMDDMYK